MTDRVVVERWILLTLIGALLLLVLLLWSAQRGRRVHFANVGRIGDNLREALPSITNASHGHLIEGNRVAGVRIGDVGVDKHGKPKPTYQPGMDIFAKVTVLGEGVRGTLAGQLIKRFELEGAKPQVYETGIKEIWRVNPAKHRPGRVVHGMLFPEILKGFHGMWLYDMKDNLISYGFVTLLDSQSPH